MAGWLAGRQVSDSPTAALGWLVCCWLVGGVQRLGDAELQLGDLAKAQQATDGQVSRLGGMMTELREQIETLAAAKDDIKVGGWVSSKDRKAAGHPALTRKTSHLELLTHSLTDLPDMTSVRAGPQGGLLQAPGGPGAQGRRLAGERAQGLARRARQEDRG